jgi:hypothetical protein
MAIYNKIYDFCKVRNIGGMYKNTDEPTPRVKFILNLLEEEGIPFLLDKFYSGTLIGYNIILPGDHPIGVTAHHDIVNPNSDNANDNSASVINAIALKKLNPSITVCLLDGEEIGGRGSERFSDLINVGEYNIDSILNFELTGSGGKNFFIGQYPGKIFDLLKEKFNPPTYRTPYNDSVTFRINGIDSCVINPLPILKEGKSSVKIGEDYLDTNILYLCHSVEDSVDKISTKDMEEFVLEISKLF